MAAQKKSLLIFSHFFHYQVAALRWKQLFEKARETSINFKVLYDALRNLESTWERDLLSKGEVR